MKALLVLAIGAAMYFMSSLLIPIVFSVLLYLLFLPLVGWFQRFRIPPGLSAAVLILSLLSILTVAISTLAEPADKWLAEAPTSLRDLQRELRDGSGRIATIQELADEVDELARPDTGNVAQEVVVYDEGIIEVLMGGLPAFVAAVGIVVFLTFFLLASGDGLVRRITVCGRTWSERRRIVTISRQIQRDLSRYLYTVTLINAALGLAVAAAMHALDVPNPILWGAMTYLMNFAPYVGALATAAALTVVGLTTFSAFTEALAVPAVFLALTTLEGQLVTPAILGKRMSLNPIAVFLAVVFWGWMWGIPGALMAVPFLTCFNVVCEHVPGLQHVRIFLSRDRENRQQARNPSADVHQQSLPLENAMPVSLAPDPLRPATARNKT